MADPNLIDLLDPNRDYGERTFEQVKEEIARGLILIEPGHNLPVLKDARTHTLVTGTGRRANTAPHEWSRAYIREQFADDAARLYQAAVDAVLVKGDMKALELLLKYGVGDHREAGADAGARAVDALFELAQRAKTERVIEVQG